jgi:hypothetical protein
MPLLLVILALTPAADWKQDVCSGDPVYGRYVNYAVGFSVGIPRDLKGRRTRVSGPERGVTILLSRDCAGLVRFDGEPNSVEYATPSVAASELAGDTKDRGGFISRRYKIRMGRLFASGVTIHYRDSQDIEDVVVAFRPRGGLMYTARLGTVAARYGHDRKRFVDTLRGFRLEPWR